MTKSELIEKLKSLAELSEHDEERAHGEADEVLLQYINDPDVSEAFEKIDRWYA